MRKDSLSPQPEREDVMAAPFARLARILGGTKGMRTTVLLTAVAVLPGWSARTSAPAAGRLVRRRVVLAWHRHAELHRVAAGQPVRLVPLLGRLHSVQR